MKANQSNQKLFGDTSTTLSANATTTSNDGAGETQIQKQTSEAALQKPERKAGERNKHLL
jgi:regulatory protein YycH of two-component signal transduction system YycFG